MSVMGLKNKVPDGLDCPMDEPNNNYGTSTFAFVSSKLWETIPTNIKRLPYTSFLNQYKLYLLNTQSSV